MQSEPSRVPSKAPVLHPRDVVDRYRVDARLGQGGMATVYRVYHLQLGSVHALKVVNTDRKSIVKRILREGRVQARLQHPNVVRVTDVIEVAGTPGLVLEYVAGPTLAEILQFFPVLTVPQIDWLADAVLRGVEVAHGLGFAHRDLKPANILVAESQDGPVAKVADFGLAKILDWGSDATRPNIAMGTPAYMAPEQISDARSADLRSDVFSLGAILYELCTGRQAFVGATVFEIFRKVGNGECAPLREQRPDLPERMIQAIERALSIDREARPQTASDLRALWTDPDAANARDPFGSMLEPLFAPHRAVLSPFTPDPENVTPAPVPRVPSAVPPPFLSPDSDSHWTPVPPARVEPSPAAVETELPPATSVRATPVRETPVGTTPSVGTTPGTLPTPATLPTPRSDPQPSIPEVDAVPILSLLPWRAFFASTALGIAVVVIAFLGVALWGGQLTALLPKEQVERPPPVPVPGPQPLQPKPEARPHPKTP